MVAKRDKVDLRLANVGSAVLRLLRITALLDSVFRLDDDDGPDLLGAAVPLLTPPKTGGDRVEPQNDGSELIAKSPKTEVNDR